MPAAVETNKMNGSATTEESSTRPKVIDVHTHMYYPAYMDMLRKREQIPKVVKLEDGEERLVILPNEENHKPGAKIGRPIGREYFDPAAKVEFMDQHGIDVSVVSLANPWLNFLKDEESPAETAKMLNESLNTMCSESNGRLLGFATLPVNSSEMARDEMKNLEKLDKIKGIIVGTTGVADKGFDAPEMDLVYAELERQNKVMFIHPHYGIRGEDMSMYGHSLELALGFPMETTIAVSRLILSGVLDRFPKLKVLVAHAGGTLPWLCKRIDSCVGYEKQIALKKKPSDYLKSLYFDAIIYDVDNLEVLRKHVGDDKIMFGTDHPFFPPVSGNGLWESCTKVFKSIETLGEDDAPPSKQAKLEKDHADSTIQSRIFWDNGAVLFGLDE